MRIWVHWHFLGLVLCIMIGLLFRALQKESTTFYGLANVRNSLVVPLFRLLVITISYPLNSFTSFIQMGTPM